MAEKLPPEVQAQLAKFQQLKGQLDRLLLEKSTIENELREINRVLDELATLNTDATIYKIVGNLLIKSDKASIEKELNDRKELLELRSRTYQKQESILRKQLEDLQAKINEILSRYNLQGGQTGIKA
ncbi:MAG: prefoldin subunit beta [Saccharolobus sp.]